MCWVGIRGVPSLHLPGREVPRPRIDFHGLLQMLDPSIPTPGLGASAPSFALTCSVTLVQALAPCPFPSAGKVLS